MRADIFILAVFGIYGGSMIAYPAPWRRYASGRYGWFPRAWWGRAGLTVYRLLGVTIILEAILVAAVLDGRIAWPRFLHSWQPIPR
jgi:hypothetical protein